jgi:hypothetical protein
MGLKRKPIRQVEQKLKRPKKLGKYISKIKIDEKV